MKVIEPAPWYVGEFGLIVGSAGFSPCLACGIYPADSPKLRYNRPRLWQALAI